jgi:hypothetical protein
MRASRKNQAGMAGQNEVAANFERLGWGPVPNPTTTSGPTCSFRSETPAA